MSYFFFVHFAANSVFTLIIFLLSLYQCYLTPDTSCTCGSRLPVQRNTLKDPAEIICLCSHLSHLLWSCSPSTWEGSRAHKLSCHTENLWALGCPSRPQCPEPFCSFPLGLLLPCSRGHGEQQKRLCPEQQCQLRALWGAGAGQQDKPARPARTPQLGKGMSREKSKGAFLCLQGAIQRKLLLQAPALARPLCPLPRAAVLCWPGQRGWH